MSEYRICEICRFKNVVNASKCSSCGADISFVMVSEEEDKVSIQEDDGANNTDTVEAASSRLRRVKICDVCNHANDETLSECESCNNDIFNIRPAILDENKQVPPITLNPASDATVIPSAVSRTRATTVMKRLMFTSVHDGHQISVPDSGGIMGREGIGSEYLNKSNYVSREHACITYVDDKWMMTVLGVNPTLINERVVPKGEHSVIEHGDVVRLADLDFNIELK